MQKGTCHVALGTAVVATIFWLEACGGKKATTESATVTPTQIPEVSYTPEPQAATGGVAGSWTYRDPSGNVHYTMTATATAAGVTATVQRNLSNIGMTVVQNFNLTLNSGGWYVGSLVNSYSNGCRDTMKAWWQLSDDTTMNIVLQCQMCQCGLLRPSYSGYYSVTRQ